MKDINIGQIKQGIFNKVRNYVNENSEIPSTESKLIKNLTESKIMLLQLEVFDSLMNESFTDKAIAKSFINENLSLFNSIKINDLLSENKKYEKVVSLEPDKIDESIHTLIKSSCHGYLKDSTQKISESYKALDNIINYLCENKPTKVTQASDNDDLINENFDKVVELFGNKIQDKYGDMLNESDNEILSKLLVSDFDAKKEIYESLKNSVVESLTTLSKNENYKSKTTESINKINAVKLDESNINKNIFELHTLKEQLA